ncbi:aminotransferase class I/II-fold pyridoxal phosphate-dependent enzyme [Bifidobacterium longum]|uniref:aminotransferase class I/II-fold pyridoxal phosphate-dependent enzyme n=1 Tax=Bifidobacterium longum TaxID=216816 RepID=UPI002D21BF15|nr:aminotransferase class I/II-fold pyridoxal phosphate-dependent enzyme [Bifidobacterium longum]
MAACRFRHFRLQAGTLAIVEVLNDSAYAGLEFGDVRSLSLLETPGALDVALELGSLSKMYMVAGWRGGMAIPPHSWIGCSTRPAWR